MDINFETGDDFLQKMPYNLEAEQSVLGSLLLEPSNIAKTLEYIKPECFFREQHRGIFNVILRMFSAGTAIDFVTVLEEVTKSHIFDTPASAKVYLAQLMEMVPTTSNIENYCKIVQEKFYIRSLITAAKDIIETAQDGQGDAKNLLDMAEQRIFEIRQGKDATGLVKIDEVIIAAYDHLQKLSSNDKDKYLGVPSGFSRLDTLVTGLNKSDLIL
ncbi:MAG: dnaB, partial [Oscillospiraceae bacterium]|nr:dnaB [Oscillospiraceae bacterium]